MNNKKIRLTVYPEQEPIAVIFKAAVRAAARPEAAGRAPEVGGIGGGGIHAVGGLLPLIARAGGKDGGEPPAGRFLVAVGRVLAVAGAAYLLL